MRLGEVLSEDECQKKLREERSMKRDGKSEPAGMKWEILEKKAVIDMPWLHVEASKCRLPDGTVIDPFYVYHMPDFVVVAALTKDEELILVRQYRHGVEKVLLELPAGMIEAGEKPEQAAARELLEETGYQAESMEFLFKTAPNASNCDNYAYCFLARDARKVTEQHLDPTEDLVTEAASLEEAERILRGGGFEQAVHIAILYRVIELLR